MFDSLYHFLPKLAKAQIANLLCTKQDKIEVHIMDVQMQVCPILSNILLDGNLYGDIILYLLFIVYMQSGTCSSDCGLFAVAYATSVAFGKDPGRCHFNQQQMRVLLHDCFLNGILTPFPHEEKEMPKANGIRNRDDIAFYCHCCMPELNNVVMIECSNYTQWYLVVCGKVRKKY